MGNKKLTVVNFWKEFSFFLLLTKTPVTFILEKIEICKNTKNRENRTKKRKFWYKNKNPKNPISNNIKMNTFNTTTAYNINNNSSNDYNGSTYNNANTTLFPPQQQMPPPVIPIWFHKFIFGIYILLLCVGGIGNALICYVLVRKKRKRSIHLLTLNLAISDLIVSVMYVPTQMYLIQVGNCLFWFILYLSGLYSNIQYNILSIYRLYLNIAYIKSINKNN